MKALNTKNFLIGDVPKGWDIKNFGLNDEIITGLEKDLQYTLVCIIDALLSSGITDPYDFYKYIHISELAITIGCNNFKLNINESISNSYFGLDKKNKYFSEWINFVLFGSIGPIKIPIQNYATCAVSLEMGCDLILQDKAKIVIVGGSNNNEKSIVNKNILGASIQILTTAELAIEIGLPIYAICSYTNISSNISGKFSSEINKNFIPVDKNTDIEFQLDYSYRINNYKNSISTINNSNLKKYFRRYWGHLFYKDNKYIPEIKGALSVWGLSIDDIDQIYFCSESDNLNIGDFIETQMQYLDRSEGNPIAVVELSNTIGASALSFGFLINSSLKSLDKKIILGNKEEIFLHQNKNYKYVYYPDNNFPKNILKTILIKSFSDAYCTETLLISPEYLLAHLDTNKLNKYLEKLKIKNNIHLLNYQKIITGEKKLINLKKDISIKNDYSYNIYLDPFVRIEKKNGDLVFTSTTYNCNNINSNSNNYKNKEIPVIENTKECLEKNILNSIQNDNKNKGMGITIQSIYEINLEDNFINNNFTKEEINYCNLFRDSKIKFLSILVTKDAILKTLYSLGIKISKINNLDIKISINCSQNQPNITFTKNIEKLIEGLDLRFKISISNCAEYALAVVVVT